MLPRSREDHLRQRPPRTQNSRPRDRRDPTSLDGGAELFRLAPIHIGLLEIRGTFFSGGGSPRVASYTPVQHTYPGNPLPPPCWISQFFDHVTNGKTHRAQDVDYYNSNTNKGLATPYGTPVYAAEGGTVVAEASGNGPAAQGYPACAGQNMPANYVKIQGSDGYYTVYVHVTPTVATGVGRTRQPRPTNRRDGQFGMSTRWAHSHETHGPEWHPGELQTSLRQPTTDEQLCRWGGRR